MKTKLINRIYSHINLSSILFLLFISCFVSSKAQLTTTIGAGSISTNTANSAVGDPGPMYRSSTTSTFIFSRYHYLYNAQELAASGITPGSSISRLAWFKNNSSAANSACLFQVWIKNSALSSVGPGGQVWSNLIANSAQVYTNSAHQVDTVIGWHEIIFSSPYLYTGGALEISTNFDISQGTSPWSTGGFTWKKDSVLNSTLSYAGATAPGSVQPNLRIVRPQVRITYTTGAPCAAPPAAGTISTNSNSVCSGANFSLYLSGSTTGSGLTYQWDSSPDSVNWTAIPSATYAVYGGTQTTSTYYRCTVTCAAQSSTTPGFKLDMNSFINCYCTSSPNAGTGSDIGNVSFLGLNNGIGAPNVSNPAATNTYSDFTGLTPVTVNQGGSYPITITQINSGTTTTTSFTTASIDFDHNGVFDAPGEVITIGATSNALGNIVTNTIAIPLTAQTGLTRMRLILRTSGSAAQLPCGPYGTGETEDYFINIDLVNQLQDLEADNNFSLSPNPTSDFIALNFSNANKEVANLKILSLTNQLLYEETINSNAPQVSKTIDLNEFPNGIYFVQLSRASGILTRKFILE
jgi:hypothetical protein